MRPATSGRWIQLRPRVRGTDGSGPETRDNRSKRPRRTIFGGAVKAQQSCATFKDRNTRVEGRVRGAMGKKKGRLKVLSSAYTALVQRLFTQDANVRNVKAYFSLKRAKFDPRVALGPR